MATLIKTNGSVITLKPTGDAKSIRKRDIAIAIGGSPMSTTLSSGSILITRSDQENPKLRINSSASSIFRGTKEKVRGDAVVGNRDEFET